MEIINKKIKDIIPYEKNPRNNDEAVKYVANSIKEFGFKVPIIIDKDNVIVAGHTRYKASLKLNLEEVPCIIADDLSEEQIRAYRLADNKVSEKSTWDMALLEEELNQILNINMEDFDFDFAKDIEDIVNPYSQKINIPQYEITGEKPDINCLVDDSKVAELLEDIKKSNVSDEEKTFLINGAMRHLVFNYKLIAEYYAGASKEMQELMEKSALVIIDLNNAISNGYVQMIEKLKEMVDDDDEE